MSSRLLGGLEESEERKQVEKQGCELVKLVNCGFNCAVHISTVNSNRQATLTFFDIDLQFFAISLLFIMSDLLFIPKRGIL